MIVVKGELRLKADERDGALGAIRTAVAATRSEAGCAAYVYSFDLDDPAVVHIFEEWADEDAMSAHMASPHIAELLGALGGAIESVSLTRYEATGSSPLM